jgi:hypothetical protein
MKFGEKYIYRILPFEKAIHLLEGKKLSFSRPSSWYDPFERDYDKIGSSRLFAQCWSLKGYSDAMWRIYSKNKLGVRISSSTEEIEKEIVYIKNNYEFDVYANEVKYFTTKYFRKEQEEADPFGKIFIKRKAFDHEKEYRIVLRVDEKDEDKYIVHDKIEIELSSDPLDFIYDVLLDPWASPELVEALTAYFKNKFGSNFPCSQSQLYRYKKPSRRKSRYTSERH